MLNVQGVTPEILFGTYVPGTDPQGPRLKKRAGLVDCLSVFGAEDTVDINTAQPAVLAAVGVPPEAIAIIVQRRAVKPFTEKDFGSLGGLGISGAHLRLEGNSIVTIRATAQARRADGSISDVKRTVAAMVKYMPKGYDSPIHVLRWYDTAFSDARWVPTTPPLPFGVKAAPPEGSN